MARRPSTRASARRCRSTSSTSPPATAPAPTTTSPGPRGLPPVQGRELLDWTSAPHAPYTVSDETFIKLRKLAEEHDLQIHCHIHETAGEVADSVKQYGMRPLARLEKLGLMSERLIAVHMVHLDEAGSPCSLPRACTWCCELNLKLASGIAPVKALEAAGVTRCSAPMAPRPTTGSTCWARSALPRCWPRAPPATPRSLLLARP